MAASNLSVAMTDKNDIHTRCPDRAVRHTCQSVASGRARRIMDAVLLGDMAALSWQRDSVS
ncbi:MAG: hypothetical protein ACRCTD_04965 [Beijerinckiaceae bacterium]